MRPQPLPLLQLLLHLQKKQRQPRALPGEAAEEEFTGEANQERKVILQTSQSPTSLEVDHLVAGVKNNDEQPFQTSIGLCCCFKNKSLQ